MDGGVSGPMDTFESWLLHSVAQAVEAGEVPADLLAELQAEMVAARGLPQEGGHALAVQDIAERLNLPVEQAEELLATLEAQPAVTRELILRRIVEAWLAGQRDANRSRPAANTPGEDPR